MPHPIENIMETSMEQLKDIADVNTVVGKPITAGDKAVILPISKVTLGFLSGGGEYGQKSGPVKRSGDMMDTAAADAYPFAGTAVAGMSLTPMGFLYVNEDRVRLLSTSYATPIERIMDAVPQALQIVEGMAKKGACKEDGGTDA